MRPALPIDDVLPEIVSKLSAGSNLVLEAPPGAGKTTRVPPALLSVVSGEVLVLEPRRIAARMAARRVAEECGERLGGLVGYHVRFEEAAGPHTKLRFLTEGILTRRLLSDPTLRNVSAVILDEFHERHLDADLALALLRRLQRTERPDLKLLVMSATLNAEPIARYLGGCPVVRSEGRMFDVAIAYTPHSSQPLEEQVAAALQRHYATGDVLVFLPGAAEIRRAMRSCEAIARTRAWDLLPLHGDLSPAEQDRAVLPAGKPKIILSTNVAESSITIDGVDTVIDSGLARVASDSPWTGLPTLQIQRVSKSSAIQRAGRAGRTKPGSAIRLYSLEDFQRRPDYELPEILRRDLSQVLLELRTMEAEDVEWFEPPPVDAWASANALLDLLRANKDTPELARLPVHPRVARLLLDSARRGVVEDACRLAAWLGGGERSEVLDVFDVVSAEPSWRVRQIEGQLRKLIHTKRSGGSDDDLRLAILAAFPDRVARRRNATNVQLSSGKPARLAGEWQSELLIALDVEERKEAGVPLIRLACGISPEALVDSFPERIEEREQIVWNRDAERVEASVATLYDSVIIEETRTSPRNENEAASMLAAQALDAGLHRFVDMEELDGLLARSEFASAHSNLPQVTTAGVHSALQELCTGLRSFKELEAVARNGLLPLLKQRAGGELLNEVAPERLPLKGRPVKVNYASGQPPWIASRLQDFFGMRETPRIARGAVPLVAHLLAPNRRPVQTTIDLAGFWERLYPQVRRELSRRYPRHAWPENPAEKLE